MNLVLLIVIVAVLGCVRGEPDCPAPLPCTCIQQEIVCEGENLYEIPTFQATSTKYQRLRLGNNAITNIDAGAFQNLNVNTEFLLDLDDNKISRIATGAFQGISDKLRYLYLSGNRLDTIPDAIGELTNLKFLWIVENPVSDINDLAIQAVATTMTSFHFGSEQVTSWPSALKRLNVNELKLNIPFTSFPVDAFVGKTEVLEILEIKGGKFAGVPIGMGVLSKLHTLTISDNPILDVEAFPDSVLQGLGDTLVTLNLPGNRLATMPKLLEHLPSLTTLDLSNNPINFIHDMTVPENSQLQILGLSRCQLKRYPAALSKLALLKRLDMSNNNMKTLENMDFASLSNLVSLDLKNNPVVYVASRSFQGVPSLQVLDMSNMQLTNIPTAVKDLTQLKHLDLTGNAISCTCALSWMSEWTAIDSVNIIGGCDNIEATIADFIKTSLPFCPL